MENKEITKKKKQKNKSISLLTVLLMILLILIVLAAFILTRRKPDKDINPDFNINVEEVDDIEESGNDDDIPTVDDSVINQTLEAEPETELADMERDKDWNHYLLLGVDVGSSGKVDNSYTGKRSDAMIVLSVNKKECRVVLSSVPRDTLVYIEGKGFDKLTHAYAYGGADLTVKTYENNFDINIDNYITVNFLAMEKIVDLLGGLTLTLTDAEAEHMDVFYGAWGVSGGTQKLNGKEVLAYCRVRKIDSDFKRTERQYNVLVEMYKAVKDLSPAKYGALITTAYEYIHTDMMVIELMDLAADLLAVLNHGVGIEHVSLVENKYCSIGRLGNSSVVVVDNLVKTAERWRENLGIENYEPSNRLQKISSQLDSAVGR